MDIFPLGSYPVTAKVREPDTVSYREEIIGQAHVFNGIASYAYTVMAAGTSQSLE